jgi:hypothetical protein
MWETIANISLIVVVFIGVFFFIKGVVNSKKEDLPNPPSYTPHDNLYEGKNDDIGYSKASEMPVETKNKEYYEKNKKKRKL